MKVRNQIRFGLKFKVLLVSFVMLSIILSMALLVRRMNHNISQNFAVISSTLIPSLTKIDAVNAAALSVAEFSKETALQRHSQDPARKNSALFLRDLQSAQSTLRLSLEEYNELANRAPEEYPIAAELNILIARLLDASNELYQIALSENLDSSREQLALASIDLTDQRIILVISLARHIEVYNLREREVAARHSIQTTLTFVNTAVILAIILVGAFGLSLALSLIRPILALQHAAQEIGAGKLSTRVDISSRDEFGKLACEFNSMVENLAKTTVTKSFLDNILASMIDVLLVFDREGIIIQTNPFADDLLGYPRNTFIGLPIQTILPNWERVKTKIEENNAPLELQLLTKDQQSISVSASISSFESGGASNSGFVLVAKDIRAQKEVDAELRRYRESLAHAEQLASLGTVSALLAHKLNQPLTVINLLLQQGLRSLHNPEAVSSKIHECLSEIALISSTVKEVLRFTRPVSRHEVTQVQVAEVVKKICLALEDSCREAGLLVTIRGFEQIPPILLNESEFEEICFTLIENAIQAVPPNHSARLTISGEIIDYQLVMEFKDTCCGIPKENLDKIFDLFFSTKSRQHGTGLGLSIVKQIVTNRGGEISVRSESSNSETSGTTFRVTLPLLNEHGGEQEGDLI